MVYCACVVMQQTHPLSKATMKPGIKAMLAAAALLVALGGLQIAVAQQGEIDDTSLLFT